MNKHSDTERLQSMRVKLLDKYLEEMHVSWSTLMPKFFGVGIVSAALLLSFCSQMGVGGGFLGIDLAVYFAFAGHFVCELACGAFWIGGTLFVTALFCERHELRFLIKKGLSLAMVATFSAVIFLMLLGAELGPHSLIPWLLGALLFSTLGMPSSLKLKRLYYGV